MASLGGEFVALVIGDSIGAGVGEDPTGDGSDELSYGGATPDGTVYKYDSGSWTQEATYTDSAGAAPLNPGLVPHIIYQALAAGYSSVKIYRHAVSGASTPTTQGYLEQSISALAAAGVAPHVVVPVCGTNDANNSTQSDLFNTTCPAMYAAAEAYWPSVRIVHVQPIAAIGAKSEADVVRAYIVTHTSARSTRSYVSGAGLAAADTIHPTLETYQTQGRAVVTAYLSGG